MRPYLRVPHVLDFLRLNLLRNPLVYLLNLPLPEHLLDILFRGRREILEQIEFHFSEALNLIDVEIGALVLGFEVFGGVESEVEWLIGRG